VNLFGRCPTSESFGQDIAHCLSRLGELRAKAGWRSSRKRLREVDALLAKLPRGIHHPENFFV
jgi:hypothetical protein